MKMRDWVVYRVGTTPNRAAKSFAGPPGIGFGSPAGSSGVDLSSPAGSRAGSTSYLAVGSAGANFATPVDLTRRKGDVSSWLREALLMAYSLGLVTDAADDELSDNPYSVVVASRDGQRIYKIFAPSPQAKSYFDMEASVYKKLKNAHITPILEKEHAATSEENTSFSGILTLQKLQKLLHADVTDNREALKKNLTNVMDIFWSHGLAHEDLFVDHAGTKMIKTANFVKDAEGNFKVIDFEKTIEDDLAASTREQEEWARCAIQVPRGREIMETPPSDRSAAGRQQMMGHGDETMSRLTGLSPEGLSGFAARLALEDVDKE